MKKYLRLLFFFISIVAYFFSFSQTNIATFNDIKYSKSNGISNIITGGAFGWDCDTLGDLDGDGVMDLVIGAPYSFVNSQYSGRIHILFMNSNKTIKSTVVIDRNTPNFNVPPGSNYDLIGITLCNIGDFNHDGTNDLAIGLENNNQVSLLMLNPNGTVNTTYNLTTTQIGFFGSDIINLGDIDGDGVTDIMISGYHNGIYICKLNANGTIKNLTQFLSSTSVGYTGTNADNFPASIRQIGDLDGNGIKEIVATAPAINNTMGEIAILFLNTNYTLSSIVKIQSNSPNFTTLNQGDNFGCEVQKAGDLNGDGIEDIFVGAMGDDNGGSNTNYGAVYGICLNNSGGVKSYFKIDKSDCNLGKFLDVNDYFGLGVSVLGDIDHDGLTDYLMTSFQDNDGGAGTGAAYILNLGPGGSLQSNTIDTSFCFGNSIILKPINSYLTYNWNNGSSANSITVSNSGIYYCELTDSSGCSKTDTFNVTVYPSPIKHLIQSKEICIGDKYTASIPSGFNYLWSNGNTSNTITIADSGLFYVDVWNQCDTIRDTIIVKTKECNCRIVIPNAFTPTEDAINDYFFPSVDCELDDYHLLIYNRWGQLMYETTNQYDKWDGKYKNNECSQGVYFFVLYYKNLRVSKDWLDIKGSVTLIR